MTEKEKKRMDAAAKRIIEIIDGRREELIALARDIYTHAEMGYREVRTSRLFEKEMRALGLPVTTGHAVTGVRASLNQEKAGNVSIALLGEMDALMIPSHVFANPETGAAHCCGHHAQLAGVIGAAWALSDPEVRRGLDGQTVFFAVPAEEFGEIAFRKELMREGKIRYFGGKSQLIQEGALEDIDLCVTHHSHMSGSFLGDGSGNGFVSKVITCLGRSAHAAARPEEGINALNAVSLGLSALAFQRETFRDQDCVRVHPILTEGGTMVNAVPERAVVETLVRAGNVEAMRDAAEKTDRAFLAGALAIGARCEIETHPGYLPYQASETPEEIRRLVRESLGREILSFPAGAHSAGSSDVGDVQSLMPCLAFKTGGVTGGLHSAGFAVTDEEEAYVLTAKLFALHAWALLRDGAALAKKIRDSYKPLFASREEYLAYMESMRSCPDT